MGEGSEKYISKGNYRLRKGCNPPEYLMDYHFEGGKGRSGRATSSSSKSEHYGGEKTPDGFWRVAPVAEQRPLVLKFTKILLGSQSTQPEQVPLNGDPTTPTSRDCKPSRDWPVVVGEQKPPLVQSQPEVPVAPQLRSAVPDSDQGHDRGAQGDDLCSLDTTTSIERSSEPRDREAMFFLNLEDSSSKAEYEERRRRKAALQESLLRLEEPVHDDFFQNAAILPDFRPGPAPSSPASASEMDSVDGPPWQDEPLLINGLRVEEYQAVYRSVVEPMLRTPGGRPRPYSLELGRRIKQRLYEALLCPALQETLRPKGRVQITETPQASRKRSAPDIDVDVSGEPAPPGPKRKRGRR